jgi:hypothetical protein
MLEDKLLILRFNRGDRSVLHRVYDKCKDDLVTLAAALLMDRASAEDVVHDVFLAFLARPQKELGRSVIDGVAVEGIEVTDPPTEGEKLENAVGRLWVDIETELPIRIEIEGAADGQAVRWLMEFQWSEAVAPALFEPNIPSDYTPLMP